MYRSRISVAAGIPRRPAVISGGNRNPRSVNNDLNSSLYKFASFEVLLICPEVGQKYHSREMKKKDAFRVLQGNIISSLPSTLHSTRRQNHMMDTFRNEIREDADK